MGKAVTTPYYSLLHSSTPYYTLPAFLLQPERISLFGVLLRCPCALLFGTSHIGLVILYDCFKAHLPGVITGVPRDARSRASYDGTANCACQVAPRGAPSDRHDKISFEESDSDQDLEELDDEAVYNLSDDEDADEDSDDEDETIRRLPLRGYACMHALTGTCQGAALCISSERKSRNPSENRKYDRKSDRKSRNPSKNRKSGLTGRHEPKRKLMGGQEEEEVDEEEDSEYEREARRQQQEAAAQLRPEDYGAAFSDEGDDDSDEDEKETLGHRSRLRCLTRWIRQDLGGDVGRADECVEHKGDTKDGGVEEKVEREGAAALLPEERRAAILADAPVLADVLTEMQSSLDELRTRISPLLQELHFSCYVMTFMSKNLGVHEHAGQWKRTPLRLQLNMVLLEAGDGCEACMGVQLKGGQIATADGLSYLEAKNHLLLHYIATLAFLVLLRAEGRPFQEHPAVLRVVELRALLDKIRPLDRRLAYQVDRLVSAVRHLRAAGTGPRGEEDGEGAAGAGPQGMAEDPLQFRPKPEALQVGEGGAADGAAGDGIYRPPRLNPVSMDDDPDNTCFGSTPFPWGMTLTTLPAAVAVAVCVAVAVVVRVAVAVAAAAQVLVAVAVAVQYHSTRKEGSRGLGRPDWGWGERRDTQRAERRREEHRRRKAGRSEFVQSMVADYLGAPEEVSTTCAGEEEKIRYTDNMRGYSWGFELQVHIGGDLEQSTSMRTLRDRFKHRSEMEEELFIRRNLSKEERKALASHKRAALSGGMLLEDLADDITGIIQMVDYAHDPGFVSLLQQEGEDAKKASTADEMWQRQRVSQKFGADLSEAGLAGRSKRSGDADLPFREPLSDRRARMDSVRALKDRRGKDNGDFSEGDVEEFDFGGSKKGKEGSKKKRVRTADEDEDPFYRETAKKSKMRKEARGRNSRRVLCPRLWRLNQQLAPVG
eukprot:jgi/Botrbrau1/499/Bobra.110_2s0129.1